VTRLRLGGESGCREKRLWGVSRGYTYSDLPPLGGFERVVWLTAVGGSPLDHLDCRVLGSADPAWQREVQCSYIATALASVDLQGKL